MSATIEPIANEVPEIKTAKRVRAKKSVSADVAIKSDIVPAGDKGRSESFIKAQKYQMVSGVSVLSVGAVLTGLSLSHLAHGIQTVTGCALFDSWSMAIGVDAGFIAVEMAMLFSATETVRKSVETYGKPTVIVLIVLSMMMNAFAFASAATCPVYAVVSGILGMTIPALVYVLTRIAFVMLTTLKK